MLSVDPRVNSGVNGEGRGSGAEERKGWRKGRKGAAELGTCGSKLDHRNGLCRDREVPGQSIRSDFASFFPFTGCITWFSELENDVENANKTTNPIGIFTAWNIVMVI